MAVTRGACNAPYGVNTLRRLAVLFIFSCVLSGCTKVSHMDQLLTLKGVADEQMRIKKFVDEQDRKFDKMVEEAKAGTLDQHMSKRKFVRAFGEPVYVTMVREDDRELESWLYRHATAYFHADKIYLYFDADGNLVRSEYQEAKDGEVQ